VLIRMLKGKDLYYPGELISLDDATAQSWVAAGLAEPALCPECGTMLEPKGYGACCPECGTKKWESIA
jgi:tRNA(Ile2) C34 agmatinyltransferase TiaS